jgi:hypothetical protein
MRPLRALTVALLALALLAGGTPAHSQSGADLVQACLDNGGSAAMCRGLYQTLRIPGGVCRDLASNDPACAIFDGIEISEALVLANEHSWLTEALSRQHALDDNKPLQDELWPHTHNSFNADAYPFQVAGGLDRNQKYVIRDQLRMGIRAVEIDIHWAPRLVSGGANAVQVCHGEVVPLPTGGVYHLGCEIGSPLLTEHLAEIKAWMDDNPNEVVMLYLENTLDDSVEAHNLAAAAIDEAFGSRVYKPATNCGALPMDTSRKTIRDSGARIIITGNCGPGNWGAWVHAQGPRWREGGLDDGDDFPAYPCTEERADDNFPVNWIRHWGDETGLSAGAGEGGDVTPTDALNMVRCGVNMVGWDNLVPFDERLGNLVWSWLPNEPSQSGAGFCATHGSDGRFFSSDCSVTKEITKIRRRRLPNGHWRRARRIVTEHFTSRRYTCFDGANWSVTSRSGRWSEGAAACAAEGKGAFSVPWNGYENERLKDAKGSAGAVWLNYHAASGGWVS